MSYADWTLASEFKNLKSDEYVDRIYVFYNHKSAFINYEKTDRVGGGGCYNLVTTGSDGGRFDMQKALQVKTIYPHWKFKCS